MYSFDSLSSDKHQELLDAIANNGQALVWMSGLDKGCNYFNKPWLEFRGRSYEQEFGNGWAEGVHPDDLQRCVDIYVSAFDAREKFSMTYRLQRHDGEYRWILDEGTPLYTKDGRFTGFVGHCLDITERKVAEDELKSLNQNLQTLVLQETQKLLEQQKLLIQQSKMAMMGEMLSMIAHQWRQPLNSLGISIQDVEIAYKNGEIDDEYIAEFKSDSMSILMQMSKTIDDFRNFFRPQKDKVEFSIESSIEKALHIVKPALKDKGIYVDFCDDGEHCVDGYYNEFEQVILILLSNAKDAIVQSGVENPYIKISVETLDDSSVEIVISDNGGGVPDEIIDRIFEPYFTTKEQGKGTGIGLYMAKEIIERQMGGKLGVRNNEHGASFFMIL